MWKLMILPRNCLVLVHFWENGTLRSKVRGKQDIDLGFLNTDFEKHWIKSLRKCAVCMAPQTIYSILTSIVDRFWYNGFQFDDLVCIFNRYENLKAESHDIQVDRTRIGDMVETSWNKTMHEWEWDWCLFIWIWGLPQEVTSIEW